MAAVRASPAPNARKKLAGRRDFDVCHLALTPSANHPRMLTSAGLERQPAPCFIRACAFPNYAEGLEAASGCMQLSPVAQTTRRNQTSDRLPAASASPADSKASKAVTSVSRVCTCTRDPRFS